MPKQNLIQVTEHKKPDKSLVLEIKLNNPKKLNALNQEMIFSLNRTVKAWQNRPDLSAVFIHSEGDNFCAGGDVAELYSTIITHKKTNQDPIPAIKDFFIKEYQTDYILCNLSQPVILWGQGIVMGGGMGLFMASSYPIVTENSLLAMPEIKIGFFPDVGASYFLNQIPKGLGRYLALTACQIKAQEACYLNLTKWAFKQSDKAKVFDFLLKTSFKNKLEFHGLFNDFYKAPAFLNQQSCWIKDFEKEILKALEFKSLEAFYDYFSQVSLKDKQWETHRQNFLKASPTSLAVIFEQLKKSKNETHLKSIFEMEAVIALRMATSPDFLKGVRALLIDKTKKPEWNPPRIEALDPLELEKYFQPDASWGDLTF